MVAVVSIRAKGQVWLQSSPVRLQKAPQYPPPQAKQRPSAQRPRPAQGPASVAGQGVSQREPDHPTAHASHAGPAKYPAPAAAVQRHEASAALHAPWPEHGRPAAPGHATAQSTSPAPADRPPKPASHTHPPSPDRRHTDRVAQPITALSYTNIARYHPPPPSQTILSC